MNRLILSVISWILLCSCEVKPQKFNFGTDNCHYCKMTIVDKQHASQLVTTKGKAFKYDAIECMMNDLSNWEGPDVKLYLISNYTNHVGLIDAASATFLISDAIPSPMGANLSAFQSNEEARRTQDDLGGEILDWGTLKEKYGVK